MPAARAPRWRCKEFRQSLPSRTLGFGHHCGPDSRHRRPNNAHAHRVETCPAPAPSVGQPVPAQLPISVNAPEAFRLLHQASFGPVLGEVEWLVSTGTEAWLDSQTAAPWQPLAGQVRSHYLARRVTDRAAAPTGQFRHPGPPCLRQLPRPAARRGPALDHRAPPVAPGQPEGQHSHRPRGRRELRVRSDATVFHRPVRAEPQRRPAPGPERRPGAGCGAANGHRMAAKACRMATAAPAGQAREEVRTTPMWPLPRPCL